jgi:hypothetical protein
MSHDSESVGLMYAKYRGVEAPIPMPETLDELGEIIDMRVKPGLTRLLGQTGISPVEYAGYALPSFHAPVKMMEISQTFAALGEALKAAGLKVDPDRPKDDFWPEYRDLLIRKVNATENQNGFWTQGYREATGMSGLVGAAFLLGPAVRGPIRLLESDQFRQHVDIDFAHDAAVYVSGKLMLEGLREYEPRLQDGRAVWDDQIGNYFTNTFGLQPAVNEPTTHIQY